MLNLTNENRIYAVLNENKSYTTDRDYLIKKIEDGITLFPAWINGLDNTSSTADFDGGTSIVIAYGFDLLVNGEADVRRILDSAIADGANLTLLNSTQETLLESARDKRDFEKMYTDTNTSSTYKHNELIAKATSLGLTLSPTATNTEIYNQVIGHWATTLGVSSTYRAIIEYYANNLGYSVPTETDAEKVLHVQLTEFETNLNTKLNSFGVTLGSDSREKIALVSLTFNGGMGILNQDEDHPNLPSNLVKALQGSLYASNEVNRARAWFEIRYASNSPSQSDDIESGLAKRRFVESSMFGFFEEGKNLNDYDISELILFFNSTCPYTSRFGSVTFLQYMIEYEKDFPVAETNAINEFGQGNFAQEIKFQTVSRTPALIDI